MVSFFLGVSTSEICSWFISLSRVELWLSCASVISTGLFSSVWMFVSSFLLQLAKAKTVNTVMIFFIRKIIICYKFLKTQNYQFLVFLFRI